MLRTLQQKPCVCLTLTLFTSVSPQHHWELYGDQCPHLGEDVGALLQQRHGGLSQTGGQLDPQQLLLLGEVVLQGVSQGDGGAPVRQRVCRKEASAQQLPRRDGVCCEEKREQRQNNQVDVRFKLNPLRRKNPSALFRCFSCTHRCFVF